MNPLDELLALTHDVRAALEDEILRGARAERADAALPDAIRPEPAPSAGAAPVNAWAAIAEASRRGADEAGERGAEGLQRIREDLGDCRRCGLCLQRRHIVFGVGDADADLLVLGEAPGLDEDLAGEPLVNKAGEMLDRMLQNVLGLSRAQVYLCNIVKCRAPGRNPQPDELASCRPYVERQLRAVRPKVILVLGPLAFKALVGSDLGFSKARGTWHDWQGTPVLPTFGPGHLLLHADDKRKTFEDLKLLRAAYDERNGKR